MMISSSIDLLVYIKDVGVISVKYDLMLITGSGGGFRVTLG